MPSPLERLFGDKTAPAATPAPTAPAVRRPAPAPAAAALRPEEDADLAELMAEAAEPDYYRPYLTRSRPVLGFAVAEKNGTLHGFQYHTVRHPKHQTRDGSEYLTLSADGQVIVLEGIGLAILFRALLRHTLLEIREYDGKPPMPAKPGEPETRITRLAVADPRTMSEEERASLL